MSSKTSLNAQMPAFLFLFVVIAQAVKSAFVDIWIAASQPFQVVAFRWKAAREHYEIVLFGFKNQLTNMDIGELGTSLFEVVIAIFIVASLIGNIANATTGITVPHTGFTPNPNLTASPGAVPLTQLFPLIFVALGLMAAFGYFRHISSA